MPRGGPFGSSRQAARGGALFSDVPNNRRQTGPLYKSQAVFWRTVNVKGHRCKVPIPTTSLNFCVSPSIPSYKLPKGKYLVDTWGKKRLGKKGASVMSERRANRKYGNKTTGQFTAKSMIERVMALPGGHKTGGKGWGGVQAGWKVRPKKGTGRSVWAKGGGRRPWGGGGQGANVAPMQG